MLGELEWAHDQLRLHRHRGHEPPPVLLRLAGALATAFTATTLTTTFTSTTLTTAVAPTALPAPLPAPALTTAITTTTLTTAVAAPVLASTRALTAALTAAALAAAFALLSTITTSAFAATLAATALATTITATLAATAVAASTPPRLGYRVCGQLYALRLRGGARNLFPDPLRREPRCLPEHVCIRRVRHQTRAVLFRAASQYLRPRNPTHGHTKCTVPSGSDDGYELTGDRG